MKKIQYRAGVFETNSSSSHSVAISSISAGEIDLSLIPSENGLIYLMPENYDFGWEWVVYNDAATKAIYAWIDHGKQGVHVNRNDGGVDIDITNTKVGKVICEQTGAEKVYVPKYIEDDSYIDHQSSGTTPDDLLNFIFNKKSYLFTGNDNEDNPFEFYDVDIPKEFELVVDLTNSKLSNKNTKIKSSVMITRSTVTNLNIIKVLNELNFKIYYNLITNKYNLSSDMKNEDIKGSILLDHYEVLNYNNEKVSNSTLESSIFKNDTSNYKVRIWDYDLPAFYLDFDITFNKLKTNQ